MSLPFPFRPAGAVLAAALLAAGCAALPEAHAPQAQIGADALHLSDTAAQWPRADWWKRFGDPALDGLIERALAGNPNLQVAQARFARATAVAGIADAARYPQVTGTASSSRQRFTETSIYPPPYGGSIYSMNSLEIDASWELDFFGKNRAALDAALGNARAAQADVQAARVALAANVARAYYALGRLVAQREVATATLAQRQQIFALVRDRVGAGLDTRVELRQAEGSVPEIREQIESLNEQIALARNALAALIGAGPDATADLSPALETSRPPAVPEAIPADLLGRRADIVAARWRVEAAQQDIAVAKDEFYPNINLVAFAGFSSLGLSQWIESGSRVYGIGPAIHLPIFEGGRLRANLRARNADADAAVASYNATLLDAVHDVADVVASTRSLQAQTREQAAAQAAAEGAYDLALQRYRAGLGSYLTVLSAETNVLAQRRAAVDLKARAWELDIGLARALGGGFTSDDVALARNTETNHTLSGASHEHN